MAQKAIIKNPMIVLDIAVARRIQHNFLDLGEVERCWTIAIPIGDEIVKQSRSQIVYRGLYNKCKDLANEYNSTIQMKKL